jgi:hypothetical protein
LHFSGAVAAAYSPSCLQTGKAHRREFHFVETYGRAAKVSNTIRGLYPWVGFTDLSRTCRTASAGTEGLPAIPCALSCLPRILAILADAIRRESDLALTGPVAEAGFPVQMREWR